MRTITRPASQVRSASETSVARRVTALVPAAGVAAWVGVVAAAHLWGTTTLSQEALIRWPPLSGPWDPRVGFSILPAVALAALVVWRGPWAARRLPWRWLLFAAVAAAAAWAVSLAASDGWHALIRPLVNRFDYWSQVSRIESPARFVRTFTGTGLTSGLFLTQIRGHPPGFPLLLWAMRHAGMASPRWEATLVIAGGASSVAAVLITTREVAGEALARAAAPFLVVAPFAVTMASSADALFLGVGAWGVALIVLATGRTGRLGLGLAVAGGVVFGAGLFLSYGLLPLGAIPIVVALSRRRLEALLAAVFGAVAVALAWWAAGFSWPAGLAATARITAHGLASVRPYGYSLLGNVAAFGLLVGPATAAGLIRLRDRRAWLLVGGALLAVVAADLSGLSRAEVERIWLPFAPWVMVACASLAGGRPPGTRQPARAWLAATALATLALQAFVMSPW